MRLFRLPLPQLQPTDIPNNAAPGWWGMTSGGLSWKEESVEMAYLLGPSLWTEKLKPWNTSEQAIYCVHVDKMSKLTNFSHVIS